MGSVAHSELLASRGLWHWLSHMGELCRPADHQTNDFIPVKEFLGRRS